MGCSPARKKSTPHAITKFHELSEKLWHLRQDFSEGARKQGFLPIISELYGGFPESTAKISEQFKNTEKRHKILAELQEFTSAYTANPELLRFKRLHNLNMLLQQLSDMDKSVISFRATEGFKPTVGSFITQDEIDQLLCRESSVSRNKVQIYSYFMQGHNARECADFLKESYGTSGHSYAGFDEWRDTKGIRLSRSDDFSGVFTNR